MKVLVVGQNPSKANSDPNIPFIGTKSNITLEKWVNGLGVKPSNRILVNAYPFTDFNLSKDKFLYSQAIMKSFLLIYKPKKVITLGNFASKVLTELEVDHFKLPHPSPKNRKLNDKKWLNNELKKAKEYLWQK